MYRDCYGNKKTNKMKLGNIQFQRSIMEPSIFHDLSKQIPQKYHAIHFFQEGNILSF